jgi:acid phosphatase type 7
MLPDFLGMTPTRCQHRQTSDLLLARDIDAVLPLGDVQYEEGTFDQFMGSYDPSWGRVKAITKPVVGNHEYLTPGAAGYFDYFNGAGNQTGPAGQRGQAYYAFDSGQWRWYVLNSNCSQAGGCGATAPQVRWIRDDLQANPRACVGAAWHHPRFSESPSPDNTIYEPFWQALYEAGAELVLVAHDHNYQRYVPIGLNGAADSARGMRQFVVGNGGRNLQPVSPRTDSLRVAENDHTFGVLKLTLRSDRYDWTFVPQAGRSYADRGTAPCH